MPRLYVTLIIWAASLLLSRHLPILLLAQLVLALCTAAIAHALVIRLTTWLSRKNDFPILLRKFGLGTDRAQFAFLVVAMALWYLAAGVHDHRTPLNIAAIEAGFALGVWLYLRRGPVRRELARQVRERIASSRQT